MDKDLLECTLCKNQYDEEKHRARNLTCGHYFCHDCLEQIIISATCRCPTCRGDISVPSADMLPPNYLMDDLLRKMKADVHSKSFEENEDYSAGACPKHKKCQLYFTCNTHNVKICRDCTVIAHPPSRCQIISFEDELGERKKRTLNNLAIQMIKSEINIKDLNDIVTIKELKIIKQKEEIAALQSKIIENEEVIKDVDETIPNCMENNRKIQNISLELISSQTITNINHICQEAEQLLKESTTIDKFLARSFGFNPSEYFQFLINEKPEEFVNKIHRGGTKVSVTTEVKGEILFAQLMSTNGDILFPALASRNILVYPGITVSVSSLLTQYPSSNADIYMTLGIGENNLGTLNVKLLKNEAANFIRKLCMGTIGPTYRGSIFEKKDQTSLCIGNLSENEDFNILLPEAVTVQKGVVYISGATGLRFCISTKSIGKVFAIGDVIKGIHILEKAFEYPAGKVSIIDVGIVLRINEYE